MYETGSHQLLSFAIALMVFKHFSADRVDYAEELQVEALGCCWAAAALSRVGSAQAGP